MPIRIGAPLACAEVPVPLVAVPVEPVVAAGALVLEVAGAAALLLDPAEELEPHPANATASAATTITNVTTTGLPVRLVLDHIPLLLYLNVYVDTRPPAGLGRL
jgi:hypothetical protein